MGTKTKIALAAALLIIAALTGWVATRNYLARQVIGRQPLVEVKGDTPSVVQPLRAEEDSAVTVKIYRPSADDITVEEKSVKGSPLAVRMAETVLQEYLKGLNEEGRNTKLLGVYRDRNNILYIDFPESFRLSFNGDIKQEYNILKSLFDTLVAAVAGTEDVRMLVEGKEVESVGGHFTTQSSLKEAIGRQESQPVTPVKPAN
jgi:hypothetical protein